MRGKSRFPLHEGGGGFSSGWPFLRVVSHQGGLPGWVHQGSHSSGWSFIRGSIVQSHCTESVLSTACKWLYRWWYTQAMECLSQDIGNSCPLSAVDRAWRRYFRLLISIRETTSSLNMLNGPVMEQVLMCTAGKHRIWTIIIWGLTAMTI